MYIATWYSSLHFIKKRRYLKRCKKARADTVVMADQYLNIFPPILGRKGASAKYYLKQEAGVVLMGGMYFRSDDERACFALAIAMAQAGIEKDFSIYQFQFEPRYASLLRFAEDLDRDLRIADAAIKILIPHDLALEIFNAFSHDETIDILSRGLDIPSWCANHWIRWH